MKMKMTKATKQELRQEISMLRHIGQQFSNVAFNLSQPSCSLDGYFRIALSKLYKEWDSIQRAERNQ
jgi:hypothetical protein